MGGDGSAGAHQWWSALPYILPQGQGGEVRAPLRADCGHGLAGGGQVRRAGFGPPPAGAPRRLSVRWHSLAAAAVMAAEADGGAAEATTTRGRRCGHPPFPPSPIQRCHDVHRTSQRQRQLPQQRRQRQRQRRRLWSRLWRRRRSVSTSRWHQGRWKGGILSGSGGRPREEVRGGGGPALPRAARPRQCHRRGS